MTRLSPNHIDHCTRRIAKWAKAIRLIHALEVNLPETFPKPDSIVPGRKPFDLRIVWDTDRPSRAGKLCRQIKELLDFEAEWDHNYVGEVLELRGRIRLGEKTTMNLQLIVTYYTLR